MREFSFSPMQAAAFRRHQGAACRDGGNIQVSINFGETIDPSKLRGAWQEVSQIHSVLCLEYPASPEESLSVAEPGAAGWNSLDWQDLPQDAVSGQWLALLASDAATSFGSGPLVRFHEIHLPGGSRHYLLTVPSFLLDEMSLERVLVDWLQALENGRGPGVPRNEEAFSSPGNWKEILAECDAPLLLHPRSGGGMVSRVCEIIDRGNTGAFLRFCETRSWDAGVVLRSLWALVLRRFGATGNTLIHRERLPVARPGFFEAELPEVQPWDGTLEEVLASANARHADAVANAWIDPDAAMAANACPFDASAIRTVFSRKGAELNDAIHTTLPRWINFDARIHRAPSDALLLEAHIGPRLHLQMESPLPAPAANEILARVTSLLKEVATILDKPLREIGALRAMSPVPPAGNFPPTMPAAFRAVAAKYPQNVAVRDGDYKLTYAELDALSDKLASHLAHVNLAGGWHVALFLSPSSWIAIALLGSWKAGNVCLALDPSAPPEWIEATLSAHDVGVVLCDAGSAPLLDPSTRHRIVLDQEWDTLEAPGLPTQKILPEVPAAILAGHADALPPMGKIITQGLLARACVTGAELLGFGTKDSFLARATPGGGAFLDEWLIPLFAGGTVHVADDDNVIDAVAAPVTHLRLTAPEWTNQAARWLRGDAPANSTLRVVAVESGSPKKMTLEQWDRQNAICCVSFFSPAELCGLGLAGAARGDGIFLSSGKPTAAVEVSVCDADGFDVPPWFAGALTMKFPGGMGAPPVCGTDLHCNAPSAPDEPGQRGILIGLNAWRDDEGNFFIESAQKVFPGIPDAAAREKISRIGSGILDTFVGTETWVIADAAPVGALAVREWPLTRAGWIDETALPRPDLVPEQAPDLEAGGLQAPPEQRWTPIVVLQDADPGATLVLVHGVSGTCGIYNDLVAALGPSRRILGINARGLGNPDACHPSVESAAASYIDAILEEDTSFLLCGYGFGATLALEMVRQLAAAGRPEPRLILIGAHAPACHREESWLASVRSALNRLSAPQRPEPETKATALTRMHDTLWKAYRATPSKWAPLLIVPSDFSREATGAWKKILPEAALVSVKCAWVEMLTPPAVKRLASILNNDVSQKQPGGS